MNNKKFPYPTSRKFITVYGREGCIYCKNMKNLLQEIYPGKQKKSYKYIDVNELIEKGLIKDFEEFKKKMNIFIGDYGLLPLVFIKTEFIGGYDNFCQIMMSFGEQNVSSKKLIDNKFLNAEKELKKKLQKSNKCKK